MNVSTKSNPALTRLCLFCLLWPVLPALPAWAGGTTNIMQWSFSHTSGNIAVPIADTSGFLPAHPASSLINGGKPAFSSDIPTNYVRFCTGIGSVNFSGTGAGLSTVHSIGVASGQGMVSAAQVYAARGLTLEIWMKNPSLLPNGSDTFAFALETGGMYTLGVASSGNVGYFDAGGLTLKTTTPPAAGQWLQLAVEMANPNAACTMFTNTSAYLNGNLIGSGIGGYSSFPSRATCIGSWQYGYNSNRRLNPSFVEDNLLLGFFPIPVEVGAAIGRHILPQRVPRMAISPGIVGTFAVPGVTAVGVQGQV